MITNLLVRVERGLELEGVPEVDVKQVARHGGVELLGGRHEGGEDAEDGYVDVQVSHFIIYS